jgi:predicted nucleic acid-binding Zn ribbon protein
VSRKGRGSDDPVSLGEAVAAVGRQLGMPPPDAFASLTATWPAIVGEQLAPHTSVRSVRDGVCTIEVDGAGWATQLRYAERQLVERAEQCCGAGVVTSIRVVSRGPGTASE